MTTLPRSPSHAIAFASLATVAKLVAVACAFAPHGALAQDPAATTEPPAPSAGSAGTEAGGASDTAAPPEPEATGVDSASVVVDDEPDTEGHGLLGPIRAGAMVSVGVPALLHYSLESRFYRMVGVGLGFGGLGTKRSDIELKASHWDVRARWFPFEGSLFLGAGFGASKYDATLKKTIDLEAQGVKKSVPTTFKAKVERTELTPMLGWQWIFGPGFTMGLDFGWQLATGSSSNLTVTPEGLTPQEKELLEQQKEYQDNLKKVKDDFLDAYKGKGLPHVSFGLGWML